MRLIYDYPSFRSFLKDYYLLQKDRNPGFSYSVFARQIGLSSPAHVQLILSGKRNLTVHNIHRVSDALSLPQRELEFFEALVHHNQAETPSEKKYYQQRLELLGQNKPASSARVRISTLLSRGILPALLLSIEGRDVQTASKAASRFGYSSQDSELILKQLLKEGVASLDRGLIRLSHRHLILHDKKARSQAQKNFLSQQLRLSVKAFEKMYEKEGKFFAHTFTINPQHFDHYLEEIRGLVERTTKHSDDDPGDSVVQLNIQFFPYEESIL